MDVGSSRSGLLLVALRRVARHLEDEVHLAIVQAAFYEAAVGMPNSLHTDCQRPAVED